MIEPDGLETLVGEDGRLGDVEGRDVGFAPAAPVEGRVAGLVEGLSDEGVDGEDEGRRSLLVGLVAEPVGPLLDEDVDEVDGALAVGGLDVLGSGAGFDDGLDEDGLLDDCLLDDSGADCLVVFLVVCFLVVCFLVVCFLGRLSLN